MGVVLLSRRNLQGVGPASAAQPRAAFGAVITPPCSAAGLQGGAHAVPCSRGGLAWAASIGILFPPAPALQAPPSAVSLPSKVTLCAVALAPTERADWPCVLPASSHAAALTLARPLVLRPYAVATAACCGSAAVGSTVAG